MPETATRLPRARTPRNPEWLDALKVYERSLDARSVETQALGQPHPGKRGPGPRFRYTRRARWGWPGACRSTHPAPPSHKEDPCSSP